MNFIKISNKQLNIFFIIAFFVLVGNVFALFVFASGTTGTIDATDKYAWSENLGWINFGTVDGNIQVIDSGLSGYAWSENTGWINLNPTNGGVNNDINGNLSGYAWGENIGWVNFNPASGGVTINENGYLSGYAWSENAGWISFNCSDADSCGTVDYKVKTDWVTLRCGNGLIEGSEECDDSNTSSGDGCSSTCSIELIGGGPILPANPPQVSASDKQISYLLINSGDKYTQSLKVSLSIFAQGAIQMALSNSENFSGISWEPYQTSRTWLIDEGDGEKIVYIKFRSEQGGVSELISARINLDMAIPEAPVIIEPKSNQSIDKNIFSIYGTAESMAVVVITLDDFVVYQTTADEQGNWSYFIDTPLRNGDHYINVKVQDAVGWESVAIRIDFVISTESIGGVEFRGKEGKEEEIMEIIEFPFKQEISEKKVPKIVQLDKIIKDPYYLIPEEYRFKIPEILKRWPEQMRKIPELPKFTFLEEASQSVVDNFIKPIVFSSVNLTKKISKAIFIQAPKFVIDKITGSYKLVKYQIKRLAVLFNPPDYKDVVDLLPSLKKESSRPEKLMEKEKLFFSSIYGNIGLNQNEKGELNLVAGSNIKSFIKPDKNKEIKSVKGQLLFNSNLQGELPSGFFPFKTAEAAIVNKVQAKDWLVGQYVFVDNGNDGIYEATFQIPPVAGKYSFKAVIEYENESIKEVEVEMLIDPEGYIYTTAEVASEIIEARLPNVKTTLFWLNPLSYDWQVWPAYSYDQKNPQTTDKTGQYSFLVPEGNYYLQVEKNGYQSYASEYFEVEEGASIHQNIELNPL